MSKELDFDSAPKTAEKSQPFVVQRSHSTAVAPRLDDFNVYTQPGNLSAEKLAENPHVMILDKRSSPGSSTSSYGHKLGLIKTFQMQVAKQGTIQPDGSLTRTPNVNDTTNNDIKIKIDNEIQRASGPSFN